MTAPHAEHTRQATVPNRAIRTVSPELVLQTMRSGLPLTVIDVRERPQIHASGTLPEARVFPLHQLGLRIEELAELRATPVVVVSQSDSRARTAAMELAAAGFNEVAVMEGGIARWMNLGYPLEPRRSSPPVT